MAAHHLVINYRESFGQFASTGILFNHESPLRDTQFVTRKITNGAAQIARGKINSLTLGNIDISRDWGWAPDYVEGMISILSHDSPDDFILATGVSRTLRDFIACAFLAVGIENWEKFVSIDESLIRPAEVVSVVGDATKARLILGWAPSTEFESMINQMVAHDLAVIDSGKKSLLWKSK